MARFDAYPIPRIEELIDTVGPAKVISTLDLAKGYVLADTNGRRVQGQYSIYNSVWAV